MDRKKLRIEMIRRDYTNIQLAKDLGIKEATLYYKLGGQSEFSLSEVTKIKEVLNLSFDEMADIFFS